MQNRVPTLHKVLSHWWLEALAVVVVGGGAIVALRHILDTTWSGILLYNGDSLVLPLVAKSFHERLPFEWVFSSQLFAFPEGLIYSISSLITPTPRAALIANAAINLILLYVCFRVIAHLLTTEKHRFLEVGLSVFATGIYGIFVLLEPTADVNHTGIATLFLMSTYYYGVVLTTLLAVAAVVWLLKRDALLPRVSLRTRIVLSTIAILVIGLSVGSDPLVIFVGLAPIYLSCVVLLFGSWISWRTFGWVSLIVVGSVLLGYLLRILAERYLASDVKNYLSPDSIPTSLRLVLGSFGAMLHSGHGALKLMILSALIVLAAAAAVFGLYASTRVNLRALVTRSEYFVALFVTISSISLVAGTVLTGAPTTRYLVGLFVFPILVFLAIGTHVMTRLLGFVSNADLRVNLARYSSVIAALGGSAILVVSIFSLPDVTRVGSGAGYAFPDCLNKFLKGSDRNGVASFWTARPLDVYGSSRGEVLQIDPSTLGPFPWMVNLASYRGRDFDYVVIAPDATLLPSQLASLGSPRNVIVCQYYKIYNYRGTAGAAILTNDVRRVLDVELQDRGYITR